MKEIKNFSTKELVEELAQRGGVEEIWIEPMEKKQIDVEGPMRVLEVID